MPNCWTSGRVQTNNLDSIPRLASGHHGLFGQKSLSQIILESWSVSSFLIIVVVALSFSLLSLSDSLDSLALSLCDMCNCGCVMQQCKTPQTVSQPIMQHYSLLFDASSGSDSVQDRQSDSLTQARNHNLTAETPAHQEEGIESHVDRQINLSYY